ncbi:MAG: MmgE/PrpD family protein, partial [Gaiellaceae bacterium]
MHDSGSVAAHLGQVSVDIERSPLPAKVLDKAKLCLLDYLAAVVGGSQTAVAETGRGVLPALGRGDCLVVGYDGTTSIVGAAFFHGLIATADDLDDSHRFASGLHLSAITFPAALAIGQARGGSGSKLLRAAIAGYEIASRVCRAVDVGMRQRGFHSTGGVGPFGACTAAASTLGFDSEQTANALRIAASTPAGLFAFLREGASVRHAHGAWAAANGTLSALLCESGMSGPNLAFEGEDGFLDAYAAQFEPRFLDSPVPSESGEFEILNAYHKVYCACGHAIPAISAVLELRPKIADRLEEIREIEVAGYRASAALTNPNPTSPDEARFSLPFIVGLALKFGNVTKREMTMRHLRDPDVRRLACAVRVAESPQIAAAFPEVRAARVDIVMRDGASYSSY